MDRSSMVAPTHSPFWSGTEHHDFHHVAFTNNYSSGIGPLALIPNIGNTGRTRLRRKGMLSSTSSSMQLRRMASRPRLRLRLGAPQRLRHNELFVDSNET